jgi:hypothetical protein
MVVVLPNHWVNKTEYSFWDVSSRRVNIPDCLPKSVARMMVSSGKLFDLWWFHHQEDHIWIGGGFCVTTRDNRLSGIMMTLSEIEIMKSRFPLGR